MKKNLFLVFLVLVGLLLNACDDVTWLWDSEQTKKEKKASWQKEHNILPFVETEGTKYENTHAMYYLIRGDNREALSINELNILLSQMEQILLNFNEELKNLEMSNGNSSESKQLWSMNYSYIEKNLVNALETLTKIQNDPNNITLSLSFYVYCIDIMQDADLLSTIDKSAKKLTLSLGDINIWSRAFLKAHLMFLSYAKDKNIVAYR